jgi:hypothetical protein
MAGRQKGYVTRTKLVLTAVIHAHSDTSGDMILQVTSLAAFGIYEGFYAGRPFPSRLQSSTSKRLFRVHFRDFLSTQVTSEVQRRLIARRSQSGRWKENPFRGLQIFDFEHAPIFQGRTRAIGAVLEALEVQVRVQRPFVLVVGPSGSGKSSLGRRTRKPGKRGLDGTVLATNGCKGTAAPTHLLNKIDRPARAG